MKDGSSEGPQFKIHISDNDNENLDQNETGGNSPNFLLNMKETTKIEPFGIKPRKMMKRKDEQTFKQTGNDK